MDQSYLQSQPPSQYEYEYQVGGITWKVSLMNHMLSYKGGLAKKSIQQNWITGFGLGGYLYNSQDKNKEIDKITPPDKIDLPAISQLIIAYQIPEKMKKKLLLINIDTKNEICKEIIRKIYEKQKNSYVGSGQATQIYNELGVPMIKNAIIFLAIFLIFFFLGIAISLFAR